jgi:hypothetical protein
MAAQRQLLRILRTVDNRLCADCDCPLGATHVVYFSLDYKVWICAGCYDIHLRCLPGERWKSSQEEWSADEIQVAASNSNLACNTKLERYLVPGWPKVTSYSLPPQKQLWIRAKYCSRMFAFPLDKREIVNIVSSMTRSNPEANDSMDVLPYRIAETVAVIGPKKPKYFEDVLDSRKLEDIELLPGVLSALRADDSVPQRHPELLGHCVFPMGLRMSERDLEPTVFTFVLTNESRVKLYGAALHFHEMLEPEDLERLVGPVKAASLVSSHPIIYCPKALVIMSYYPLFHLFREVVRVFYHLSLSSAPLPLERYIYNFLKEVPLPPEGIAQVVYAMPDRLIQISRPASNKLPMTDFSYLPLFTCLSVDNVITAFRCLCAEHSVCVMSSHLALLTPVQEALLSLLFPLQWQGCYIPVMPMHMTDLLEAPVPILVGVHVDYLRRIPSHRRPARVIFINLDDNKVFLGNGTLLLPETTLLSFDNNGMSEELSVPQIPKQIISKLRARLEECGGSFHKEGSDCTGCCDSAFSQKEHLVPLTKFYDQLHSSINITRISNKDSQWFCTHSTTLLSPPKPQDNGNKKNPGVAAHRRSSGFENARGLRNILDPINNYLPEQDFDSLEIRLAFLRVFIKVIGDFREHLAEKSDKLRASHSFNAETFLASQQDDPFAKQM